MASFLTCQAVIDNIILCVCCDASNLFINS